ncbi:hypothetical protein DEO72_LG10g4158 [Vigna unguiculata]|uniref:Uncharacterized protein n=1 Tax=Vigna unguiculata TaxID=3917 RepID=A0A4D6NM03_VIGUN|nr:hypothetical protein DEO72_LG10g4158 [Vigna unguiculata]
MVPTARGGVVLSPPWKCLHLLELQLQRLGKKPREIFSESHVEMVKAGEKWAKDTASSFTIVDAISLFTSSTSVLIFIGILTSHLLQLASGGSRFRTVEASSSSFSRSSLQRERERRNVQRGEGEKGLTSFVP